MRDFKQGAEVIISDIGGVYIGKVHWVRENGIRIKDWTKKGGSKKVNINFLTFDVRDVWIEEII